MGASIDGVAVVGRDAFIEQLHLALSARGFSSTVVAVPGGDSKGKQIHKLAIEERYSPLTTSLLISASKTHCDTEIITPLINVGRNVLISNWVIAEKLLTKLEPVVKTRCPDFVVLLECSDEVMLQGYSQENDPDEFPRDTYLHLCQTDQKAYKAVYQELCCYDATVQYEAKDAKLEGEAFMTRYNNLIEAILSI